MLCSLSEFLWFSHFKDLWWLAPPQAPVSSPQQPLLANTSPGTTWHSEAAAQLSSAAQILTQCAGGTLTSDGRCSSALCINCSFPLHCLQAASNEHVLRTLTPTWKSEKHWGSSAISQVMKALQHSHSAVIPRSWSHESWLFSLFKALQTSLQLRPLALNIIIEAMNSLASGKDTVGCGFQAFWDHSSWIPPLLPVWSPTLLSSMTR